LSSSPWSVSGDDTVGGVVGAVGIVGGCSPTLPPSFVEPPPGEMDRVGTSDPNRPLPPPSGGVGDGDVVSSSSTLSPGRTPIPGPVGVGVGGSSLREP
jgi:hypothetical protein